MIEAIAAFLSTLKILHNDNSNNLSRRKSKKDIIGIVTRCVIRYYYVQREAYSHTIQPAK